jgi:pSer/pThr/pTyr-binding forkhead associated (FHA) protein
MKKVTLHIAIAYTKRSVDVGDELTIGRTHASGLVLDDSGLSRRNTTIFRDGDSILIADENSTNGTFLNGRRLSGPPEELRDGDEISIGNSTKIRVEIDSTAETPLERPAATQTPKPASRVHEAAPPAAGEGSTSGTTYLLIGAAVLAFLIIVIAGAAFLIVSRSDTKGPTAATPGRGALPINPTSRIPVRVVDPLGGENEDDLDDLIASWETAEEEIKAENVSDVKVSDAAAEDKELNVTAALLADRQHKALEARNAETGIRPAGLDVPKEIFGDGVIKQKAKLREMKTTGYHQPLDFAELAEKRMKRELIEMPMATESFYLDVGGSAQDGPFESFTFQGGDVVIEPGTPKYQILSQLAANFSGQKYDLNAATDRKQMRMRLLRMFNPAAKPILKELADAYFHKFGRPLRVTSLTRSMDYQILLNRGNPNSFKVRGEDSLPPHTSGCAFDLARKHMTAEEQNFLMQKLAQMERDSKLDALIEYGVNACFHIFIYSDGIAPKM